MKPRKPRTWTHQGTDLLDPEGRWRGQLCDALTAQQVAYAMTKFSRRFPPITGPLIPVRVETITERPTVDQITRRPTVDTIQRTTVDTIQRRKPR